MKYVMQSNYRFAVLKVITVRTVIQERVKNKAFGEMTQRLRTLAALPDYPSSGPSSTTLIAHKKLTPGYMTLSFALVGICSAYIVHIYMQTKT